jgi:Tfp pilus assembly protein PilN
MTTTLAPPETRADFDPLRLLSITANLLPAEITDARRGKKLIRIIAALLVLIVVAVGGWDFHARQQTSSARSGLNSVQEQVTSLQRDQRSYANLLKTKTAGQAITAELTTLMAQDLQWWQLLPALRATAPTGVILTSVYGIVNTTSGDGASSGGGSAALPGITSPNEIGTISIAGTATDKPEIAQFVDALAGVAGLANPYLTTATEGSGATLQFTVQIEITKSALGGRYSAASTASTATTGGK